MYNIDMYTYRNRPFTVTKKFSVHPLNEPGHDKYYSDESHCVNYLSRVNPKVLKYIVGEDYESVTKGQKEKIIEKKEHIEQQQQQQQQCNKGKTVTIKETPDIIEHPQDKQNTNTNTINNNKPLQITTPYDETVNNYDDYNYNQDQYEQYLHKTPTYYPTDKFTMNQTNFFRRRKQMSSTGMPRTSEVFVRPYRRYRDYKGHYGYDPSLTLKSSRERYSYAISDLKQTKLNNNNHYNMTQSTPFFPSNKTLTNTEPSKAFKMYHNTLRRSVGSTADNNNCETDYNVMTKSNDNLKRTLMLQTNKAFCKKMKLPNLLDIANTRQTIRQISQGRSKILGEKYDPYCFVTNTGDLIGRNYVGALYQH